MKIFPPLLIKRGNSLHLPFGKEGRGGIFGRNEKVNEKP